jgi:DNA repair photolyase
MKRFSGHKEPWGGFVDAKINAPEILSKQLHKARKGTVWISSVCDPYQPLEKKYKLTRRCLQKLAGRQFPVVIQTKCALVLRDLDVFTDFEDIQVGFTITTDDEKTAKLFEPGASGIHDRIGALRTIRQKGISTFAMLGPLLPGNPESLVERMEGFVDRVIVDRMNYRHTVTKFYREHGLARALSDDFFEEHKHKLEDQLKRRKIAYEILY